MSFGGTVSVRSNLNTYRILLRLNHVHIDATLWRTLPRSV